MTLSSNAVRRSIKRAGAAIVARALTDRRPGQTRVVCLCYHSIHPNASFASASPELFERHLAWLSENCDVISFRTTLLAASHQNRARPAVAITFDDGHLDNHEFALPLLAKYGMTATVFITAGLVDGDPDVRRRFSQLRGTDIRPLDWNQVRELQAGGLDIGAHTYSHPNLIRLDKDSLDAELRVSKELIEDRLSVPIDLLAYPFGKPGRHFNSATVEAARAAGYSYAAAVLFRSVRPSDCRLALPRFFSSNDSVSDLASKVRGDWDYLGLWQERAPLVLARVVSPGDFRP